MTENHPITPPLELLKHWEEQHFDEGENYDVMLIQAYQEGADQQLEQCRLWLLFNGHEKAADKIVEALRPEKLTNKEKVFRGFESAYKSGQIEEDLYEEIRRLIALLPNDQ